MIDKEILDAVLPLPTLDELKEQKVEELKDEGFVISNFHSGGVFYTMLMIVLRIKVEVIELLRVVLNNMFVSHAGGAWLDLKMADYSKKRKKAQKTQGFITVRRADMTGEAVKIPKGHVFKSILDINGEELRFFVLEAATLQKGASSVDVLVEAETEGSRYNVPAGQIVRTLTYLGDVTFSNAEDWIVREGSDTEDDESARARTLRSWSELAQRATEDTFIDAAESVPGVLFAQADCNHPRGQGTVLCDRIAEYLRHGHDRHGGHGRGGGEPGQGDPHRTAGRAPQPQAQRADPVRHQPRDPQRLQWGHQRGGLRAGGGCEAG